MGILKSQNLCFLCKEVQVGEFKAKLWDNKYSSCESNELAPVSGGQFSWYHMGRLCT